MRSSKNLKLKLANSKQKQSNKIIGTIVRFAESDNTFSFISYVKGTLAYWKEFYMKRSSNV